MFTYTPTQPTRNSSKVWCHRYKYIQQDYEYYRCFRRQAQNEEDPKNKINSEMKTISKWRRPKNQDVQRYFKNEDDLKLKRTY